MQRWYMNSNYQDDKMLHFVLSNNVVHFDFNFDNSFTGRIIVPCAVPESRY